jgi:uncharacterized protein (TIGR02996 family)
MNPTPVALLQACKDAPDDDLPRQILADWLEEHGDPERAELIRLQLATVDVWGYDPDAVEKEIRIRWLLRRNAERWFGPPARFYSKVGLKHGLIFVSATPRQLLDHPPNDLPDDVRPWLEELTLEADPDELQEVLSAPALGCFSGLDLSGWLRGGLGKDPDPLGVEGVRRLIANPHLAPVRSLDLSNNGLTEAGITVLARWDRLNGLRQLDLSTNPLGDEGAVALAQAPWLEHLTRLDLGKTELGARGLAAVLNAPQLTRLKHLRLDQLLLDQEAAVVLARSPQLTSVTSLTLQFARVSVEGLRLLADSPYLRPEVLDVIYSPLGEAGARVLADSRLLERVRRLFLSNNDLNEEGLCSLLRSPRLAHLEFLQPGHPAGDAVCRALASADQLGNLRRVSLLGVEVGPKGAAALARSPHLSRLAALILEENRLGRAGLRALAEGHGLPALEELNLNSIGLRGAGLEALVQSALAARLKRLELSDNHLSDQAAVALARLPDSARLVELELSLNRIGPEGLTALADCPGLSRLQRLSLYDNRVGDRGVGALVRSPYLTQLADLQLKTNHLTRAGAAALRDWPQRDRMVRLVVEDPRLPEELAREVRIE